MMADILVVDDDQSIAAAFERVLRHEQHGYRLASNAEDAVRLIAERQPDLVLMDVRMPGVDGLQALQIIRQRFPDIHVVIMTAYGTSQTSIDAIRAGAFDYITKPLDLEQIRGVIRQALGAQRLRDAVSGPDAGEVADLTQVRLIGDAPAMQDIYKMIGTLAGNGVPALVVGERGTGKQLVIETIHDNSGRSEHPIVFLDCATLPESDLAQALFGTHTGTIHVGQVDALPLLLQGRLARAMNTNRARADSEPAMAARILASSDINLTEAMASGAFNRELYEALAVITLRLPPLRERKEDIPLLVRHFVQRFNEQLSRTGKGVDQQVALRLQEHPWPGNVGELERVIKRACVVTRSDVITLEDLGDSLTDNRPSGHQGADAALVRAARTALQERLVDVPGTSTTPYHDIIDVVETTLAREALSITNGNQVKAAELLGVNRATLRKKLPPES